MKNVKTEWNFKLFYKSDADPQIQKDIEKFSIAVEKFEKTYSKNQKYLEDSRTLFQACEAYESLIAMPESAKPLMYFYFRRDSQNNKTAIAEIARISEIYDKLTNKILFFKLRLGKVSKDKQKAFLKDKTLEKYNYFLKLIFDEASHQLSESEEKILNLMSQPASEMWVSGFSKLLNNQEITFKNKTMPINEAFGKVSSLPTKDRRALHDVLTSRLKEISGFAESELNALFYKKKITDELRNYSKPYSETINAYQNETETVERLVDIVTKNFKISNRFYKIKARLMKEKTLGYADRAAEIGSTTKKFSFEETVEIVTEAFGKVHPKYKEMFESYLRNGQVDVFPKKGKKGGAYCWGAYGLPTFVLLNHTNDFRSVTTFAHEMGHAFHSELSHKQTPIYADYTISVAEVASTLFENFVFEEVFKKLSDKEKVIALHDKINDAVSSVFRQIACFNFENEAHKISRAKGFISKEDLADLMNKSMSKYLGPTVKLKETDGYFFVAWSHIRRHFYVYSYAFGLIISNALYAEYKKDAKFLEKIEQFLSAGGSKKPEDIFASIGVNIRDPKFFEKGLKIIEEDVARLEKLVK